MGKDKCRRLRQRRKMSSSGLNWFSFKVLLSLRLLLSPPIVKPANATGDVRSRAVARMVWVKLVISTPFSSFFCASHCFCLFPTPQPHVTHTLWSALTITFLRSIRKKVACQKWYSHVATWPTLNQEKMYSFRNSLLSLVYLSTYNLWSNCEAFYRKFLVL